MSLFVFNNQQKLIKSIPNRDLISVVQDQAINVSDTLFVELPADIWSNLKEPASYLAVQDPYERFSYHMYKVSKHTTKADTVDAEAIQIGYDELKAYGYIKDRRFNNRPVLEAATAIVDGTDWQLGYVDTNLPNVNTNFYYISRLEALSKLIEATGAEVRFRIEISGNKIIAKRLDLYEQLGTFKGKRFAYGSNLLEIIKEEDTSELYTALVGRGKGEETATGGFGRRITFADIAWNKASGKPVDKPLGQEFIELPEMTAYYGYPDGEPRTGIVEFGDIEEPEQLLKATYERLVEISRPQVQFKAKVQTTGDMQLGEEVAIIRSDLGFRYKTRVFRVKRDYLNNMFTEVELGDKLTETLASRIKKIDTTINRQEQTLIQVIQTAANGKNKIFRGPVEPTEGMMVNDLWYKPVGEGETMLYTWDGEIWELSKVSTGLLAGTLDAENGDVDVINLNASSVATGTLVGANGFWNLNTGEFVTLVPNDPNTRVEIREGKIESFGALGYGKLQGSELTFTKPDGSFGKLDTSGLIARTPTTIANYNADGVVFSPTGGSNSRLDFDKTNWRLRMSSYNGAELGALINGIYSLRLSVGGGNDTIAPFVNTHTQLQLGGRLNMQGQWMESAEAILFRDTANRLAQSSSGHLQLSSGQQVNIGWGDGSISEVVLAVSRNQVALNKNINMQGNTITNESDIRLKTNVVDSSLSALKEIEKMRFIEYDWDKSNTHNKNKPEGRQFGIVAQYSPFLQTKTADSESYLSVDMNKQVNLNSKAIQELKKENDTLKQELADLKKLLIEKGLI